MVANLVGLEEMPAKPGAAGKPVCGYNVQVLREEENLLILNQEGVVAVKLPLPPGGQYAGRRMAASVIFV
ncbi:hypothetical protein CLV24_10627 [Pontibacter ummariensis]|uniref:Uncharacterized protein n=1 Tax=Pontibacter ummariensis TaxID=1610492 RepID=A0A239E7U7_9BACT|nr:hypothetical protein [Pontibacter ummariensis]PRY13113.1 hypothetical protein CLV24_10627 [Pontibacter ummariensis]SNS40358.1 hypothetical protein SAMN06296052_10627 [Pontibacter ummariensis]